MATTMADEKSMNAFWANQVNTWYFRYFKSNTIVLSVIAFLAAIVGSAAWLIVWLAPGHTDIVPPAFWWMVYVFIAGLFYLAYAILQFLTAPWPAFVRDYYMKQKGGERGSVMMRISFLTQLTIKSWSVMIYHIVTTIVLTIVFAFLVWAVTSMSGWYLQAGYCAATDWCNAATDIMLFWFVCMMILLIAGFAILAAQVATLLTLFGRPGYQVWLYIAEVFIMLALIGLTITYLVYTFSASAAFPHQMLTAFGFLGIFEGALLLLFVIVSIISYVNFLSGKYWSNLVEEFFAINSATPYALALENIRVSMLFVLFVHSLILLIAHAVVIYSDACAVFDWCNLDRPVAVTSFIVECVLVALYFFLLVHCYHVFLFYKSNIASLVAGDGNARWRTLWNKITSVKERFKKGNANYAGAIDELLDDHMD